MEKGFFRRVTNEWSILARCLMESIAEPCRLECARLCG